MGGLVIEYANRYIRPVADASQGREVTVGTATSGLFRDNNIPILLPQSGSTEFTLRQGEVSLQQTSGTTAGQVQGGTLGVNFNAKTFDTTLNLLHPVTGAISLNAVGTVSSNGLLLSNAIGSNGTVTGSLSRDGTEAGYLFNLPTSVGNLSGTTLWNK